MIYLYISPSCSSCRKTKKWFDDNKIAYREKNFITTKLQKEDIFRMLKNSLNGFEDIISTRSKPFIDNNLQIDDMSTNALIEFIIENPTVLRRPIIVADEIMQVGYNQEEISAFVPKELRDISCHSCEKEENCEYNDSAAILVDKLRKIIRA